ncbi:MAG: hypothetical protein AAF628_22700 [Planctomycetota bacterium]
MLRSLVFLVALTAGPGMAHAQDPLVKQALQRIEKYEGLVETLQPGDVKTANLYINQIGWAAKRLNASSDKSSEHYKDAVTRYNALLEKIKTAANAGVPPQTGQANFDVAKLQQLGKEIGNATHNFGMLNVQHMGDAYRVGSVQKEIADFKTRLKAFPADHPAVQEVAGKFNAFESAFQQLHGRYTADVAASGDRGKQMAELSAKYETKNQPKELRYPFDPAEIRAWGERLRRLRDVEIPKDLQFVASLRGAGGIDQQKRSSLESWIGGTWLRRLNELEQGIGGQVRLNAEHAKRTADFVLETDPSNQSHVANRILGEGSFDQQMQQLQAALNDVDTAAAWDLAFSVEGKGDERKAQRAHVEKAVEHLRRVAVAALDQVRMPAAASTDAELVEIAKKTLANKKYGVGEVLRLVINAPKEHREKDSGDISHGTVSTTVTVYHYAWDQYQVCTVEKEGEEFWMYFNTLKYFTSGATTTPLNRWVLSGRFKGTRILEENIHKDPAPKD